MQFLTKKAAKTITSIFAVVVFAMGALTAQKKNLSNEIVVLYTNDVHCGIENNIGYAGFAAYKNECLKETPFVTVVDAGDAIQGEVTGAIDKGESIVKLMNAVGYDFAVFGNHEFDYGMDRLTQIVKKSKVQYLCCNLKYTGSKKNFLKNTIPFKIVKYDDIKVAYIGISTPYSIKSSTPTFFMEKDKYVFDFGTGNDGKDFIERVQNAIDAAKKDGADFVIAVAHLGIEDEPGFEVYTSHYLIKNTSGFDAVIDGHSHTVMACEKVLDKNGKEVLLSQTGTKFQNFGKLVINKEGKLSTELISSFDKKDEKVSLLISEIKVSNEKLLGKVLAKSDAKLDINDEDGIRKIRTRECAIGDLVADAFAFAGKTDIAFVNGGAIRKALPEGNVTYGDIFSIMPFGNMVCTAEVSGQAILDALEYAYRNTESVSKKDGKPAGENGGFLQVSGLKFDVNLEIPSCVKTDANGMFLSVAGERRVKHVQVLCGDLWTDLDCKAVYSVTSSDYLLKSQGDGNTMFKDSKITCDSFMFAYETIEKYLTEELKGKVKDKYNDSNNERINILGTK